MEQRMSDYLPEELWAQVLIRLPIKSILCCTAVSRSWYSLIKSPFFVSTHLHFKCRNKTQNSCLLVRDCITPRVEYYEFYHDDQRSLIKFEVFKCPFSARGLCFRIIGTCNGLLCLSGEDLKCTWNLILWNPFARRSVCLPRPNLISSRAVLKHSLGFGFDLITNDYKVVRIVHMQNESCHAEIFRLSTNSWENITDNTLANFVYLYAEQAYLDGMVHWIGKSNINRKKLVSFDMSKESFREMELPESVARKSNFLNNITVGIYMGSLAIVVTGKKEYCIWILKEYGCMESWTKQVCFEFHRNFGWPFGFRENGDIQFMKGYGRWDSYDPRRQKSKFLEVRPFTDPYYLLRSFYATPYVESLVCIDKGTDFTDAATLRELSFVFSGDSDSEHSRKSDSEQSSESDTEDNIE